MDFDLSDDELTFEKEVVAFLEANQSPEVMDANPEHLSQTVETPPKRAFMRQLGEQGWLGMSWPAEYDGQERSGIYDFLLTFDCEVTAAALRVITGDTTPNDSSNANNVSWACED